jgi:hypothetical protein
MVMKEGTTISIKRSIWKRLSIAKIRGEYSSFSDMFEDWLNSEDHREKKALKQN